MAERSISSEMVVDLAYIVEQNWRENVFEPERREAWSRAGALIITIWGHLGVRQECLRWGELQRVFCWRERRIYQGFNRRNRSQTLEYRWWSKGY